MAKKKIQKGRVYVETSKGIFPYELLQKAEMGGSKQLEPTLKWMTQNDVVPPPYPPMSLLTLYESNPVFWRCVHQLAIDTAGLGWSIKLRDDKKDNKTELDRINEFLEQPNANKDDSLEMIVKRLLIDWGTIGYFGLEVARNNKQDIAELYHVPAHTLRVHKSKIKYVQIRNNKKVWFKKFGEEKNISTKTGKEFAGRGRDRANELIFYKNYYPKSDYYGVPNVISAIGDLQGLIGLRDYNLAFFENYGIPAALITLEGDWDEGSEKTVTNFLDKEIKGAANAHRTLVMTVGASSKEMTDNTFKYQKLGTEVKEGSFKLYAQGCKENIMIAYSMPPERIGIRVVGKLGGNVATEATKIYVQSVVEPLQRDLEYMINEKLLQSEIYRFKFDDIDTRDLIALSERLIKEVASAIKTPNEARNELGLKPYIEGDKFFIVSNLVEAGEVTGEDRFAKDSEESGSDGIDEFLGHSNDDIST